MNQEPLSTNTKSKVLIAGRKASTWLLQALPSKETFEILEAEKDLEEQISNCQIAIDCLEDWQDKLLMSDLCMHENKTLIHTLIWEEYFHIYVMKPGFSPCLRCLNAQIGFEDFELRHNLNSFTPYLVMAGAFAAAELTNELNGRIRNSYNSLAYFDNRRSSFGKINDIQSSGDCPDCSKYFSIWKD